MALRFGRAICNQLATAETREWLVTNGIGGYAAGTVAGLLTRHYHGLLVAALNPPLERTLLLTKLDETVAYQSMSYPLFTNRWADGSVDPHGYLWLESFQLEGTIPVWKFALADALLSKRVWMEPGENTTYIRYVLERASAPLTLTFKAFVNYRDHHGGYTQGDWQIEGLNSGICVRAFAQATPFYLLAPPAEVKIEGQWYRGFDLAMERYRGTGDREDHLCAGTLRTVLRPGEAFTLVASLQPTPDLDGEAAIARRHRYEEHLLQRWESTHGVNRREVPDWIAQLVLAADQFIVRRRVPEESEGKTIIAGYPWFGDWGRDMAIALPGLTSATGRPEIARPILRTFQRYLSQGMLPNLFPEVGQAPEYNTVDAILWYFEAVWSYYTTTQDHDLLAELFPALAEVIDWHRRGTRYNIHLDPSDGLIYAGERGTQLTWMDAKIDDWVVTPRIGKPIEVNALWYNALQIMGQFAQRLGQPSEEYQQLATQAAKGFQRFWNPSLGYCYDVLDTPSGDDPSLRPNQIFAVSVPKEPLLSRDRATAVVDVVARELLTSHGLRSLAPTHPDYIGQYGGDRHQRDRAYHQGTVWGWLLGPFVCAHLRVYNDPALAHSFLDPIADHLQAAGIGSISEIFDGDVPYWPRGCFAQAWSVAEVLRTWLVVNQTLDNEL